MRAPDLLAGEAELQRLAPQVLLSGGAKLARYYSSYLVSCMFDACGLNTSEMPN